MADSLESVGENLWNGWADNTGINGRIDWNMQQLADIEKCEREAYFKNKYGKRVTKEQQQKMDEGNRAHEAYYTRNDNTNKNCFIASCVYGIDADETNRLRDYRDNHLHHHTLGQIFISLYYKTSPYIVRFIQDKPRIQAIIRSLLNPIIKRL